MIQDMGDKYSEQKRTNILIISNKILVIRTIRYFDPLYLSIVMLLTSGDCNHSKDDKISEVSQASTTAWLRGAT